MQWSIRWIDGIFNEESCFAMCSITSFWLAEWPSSCYSLSFPWWRTARKFQHFWSPCWFSLYWWTWTPKWERQTRDKRRWRARSDWYSAKDRAALINCDWRLKPTISSMWNCSRWGSLPCEFPPFPRRNWNSSDNLWPGRGRVCCKWRRGESRWSPADGEESWLFEKCTFKLH
jgi:hypothetical protein